MTDNGLIITRMFEAPLEQVWNAWTDPEKMKCWWGPGEFSAPVIKIDFKVGGKYLFCMRSPDGEDYWSTGVYREITPMQRIVNTDSFADENGNIISAANKGMDSSWPDEYTITVTFEENGSGRTKFSLQHEGMPAGMGRDQAREGWNGSFDKLEKCLKTGGGKKINSILFF